MKPSSASAAPVVPCASGMAVFDVRWAMEKIAGREIVAAAIERLSPAARDEYVAATAVSWVTYSTLTELHDIIAELAGLDAEKLVDRVARVTVERSFTTVWRVFLRFTSDEAIIVRTPAFYAKSRNVGRMSARVVAPGQSESVVSGFPGMPERDIVTLNASIETVLSLAGRVDVKSRGERAPDGARFSTRWTVT